MPSYIAFPTTVRSEVAAHFVTLARSVADFTRRAAVIGALAEYCASVCAASWFRIIVAIGFAISRVAPGLMVRA